MGKQSGNTSFELAEYQEYKQFKAMKAEAKAEAEAEAEAKVEAPKKRGRPAKGTTTAKKAVKEAKWTKLQGSNTDKPGSKWIPTGGKGSAHFKRLLDEGWTVRCDNISKGYTTVWGKRNGVTL